MREESAAGRRHYWAWLLCLLLMIGTGISTYLQQLSQGLVITGMSRDVPWGIYIAQFTFLVGIAASAVMVVLPYYLHDCKAFATVMLLGEALAVSAVTMCLLFIMVDMGQPARVFNVLLYPSPGSLMFWDMISLRGYLVLNLVLVAANLRSKRRGCEPPSWITPLIFVSIPWAISIHTVTAFLYCGLPGRSFWLTAILAPRFLASAFASGPALLIMICFALKRLTGFDPGRDAIRKLAVIVTYALILNLFFLALEVFTAFYSRIPEHMAALHYLFRGMQGQAALVPWMRGSALLALLALVLLLTPAARDNEKILPLACAAVFFSIWIDKGLGLIVGGFIPTPFGAVTEYRPTRLEALISVAIWAIGALLITAFCGKWDVSNIDSSTPSSRRDEGGAILPFSPPAD